MNLSRLAMLAFLAAALVALVLFLRSRERGTANDAEHVAAVSLPEPLDTAGATPEERTVVAEAPSEVPQVAEPAAVERDTRLLQAELGLKELVDASLDGQLDVNALLDQLLPFVERPLESQVDLEASDEDDIIYRVLALPENAHAEFSVKPTFEVDERTHRGLAFELQLDADESEFHRDAYREGARVHVSLSYDEEGRPFRFSLMTERKVDLRASRRNGIDAFQGEYTSGASFDVNLDALESPTATTFGLVNGNYSGPRASDHPGAIPLRGDLRLDRARFDVLLTRMRAHYDEVNRKGD